jgi:hypothetical protein
MGDGSRGAIYGKYEIDNAMMNVLCTTVIRGKIPSQKVLRCSE